MKSKLSWFVVITLLTLLVLPSLAVEDDPVVAEVGDEVWRLSDFDARLAELPEHYLQSLQLAEQRNQFLEQIAREYQLALLAIDAGLEDDPAFQRKMDLYRINVLAMMAWDHRMGSTYGISEEELHEYYDSHPELFMTIAQVRARHILFETRSEAVVALERLESGDIAFGELAKEVSIDPKTNRLGGMLGLVGKDRSITQLGYMPDLNAALFALPMGEVSAPIETDMGWHLALIEEKLEPAVKAYDQVVNQLIKRILIPEDVVLSTYEEKQDNYVYPEQVLIRIILCADEDTGKEVYRQLQAGRSFAELAREFSADELSGENGGLLGFLPRSGQINSLGGDAKAVIVFALDELADGEFSEAFESNDGAWVLIQRDAYRSARPLSYEEVADEVRGNLMSRYAQVPVDNVYAELDEQYPVIFDYDALNEPPKPEEDAAELYELAEVAPPPTAIDYYEKILDFYPKSPEASKAQFMIGFLYADKLKNYDAAEKAFNAYLENWPGEELAESASYMLEHMRDEPAE